MSRTCQIPIEVVTRFNDIIAQISQEYFQVPQVIMDLAFKDMERQYLELKNYSRDQLSDPILQATMICLRQNWPKVDQLSLINIDLDSERAKNLELVLNTKNMKINLLELDENPLGDLGVSRIMKSATKNFDHPLKIIKLRNCDLQVQGAMRIAHSLSGVNNPLGPNIRILCLERN